MSHPAPLTPVTIRAATEADVPLILAFIRELAVYEHLEHEVVARAADLRTALFGARPFAEVALGCLEAVPVGFALYFHNFSTFRGKPGIYLEDLFVRPEARGHGVGKLLLTHLARLALARGCARLDWAVLDWNEPSIRFYRSLGAVPLDDWRIFRLTDTALEQLARGG
ncbi:MAG TPA: GNAT family N-acetyltransferase [Steroidobacteraceae bacterium]|jgi:GNAT superfamily N-acetyltransferase|nr:GNAT family N-acetyltransferase [Steroidobacteraceae bacterium]